MANKFNIFFVKESDGTFLQLNKRTRGMHGLGIEIIKRALIVNDMRFITKDKLSYLKQWQDFLNNTSEQKLTILELLDSIVQYMIDGEIIYKNNIGTKLNSKQMSTLRFVIKKHFTTHVL
jgi:hypothetical protein